MKHLYILLVLFSSRISLVFSDNSDYCWREYTGTIPSDAIIGGQDINGGNIFIGQAYVKNEGLIVTQITPGAKEVFVPLKGVKNVTRYVKILCGSQDFSWIATNSTSLHVDLLNKKGVIGGHEDGLGSIYIGRISYEGGTQIGKITAFNIGNSLFRWADIYGKEPYVTSYEVLIHGKDNDNCII